MSSHLSEDALLEMAETGRPHPHVAQCPRCRRQIEAAREAIAQARAVEVPEPSLLFWEHLSSRVHDAVEAAPRQAGAPGRDGLSALWWRRIACAMLALTLVAAGVWRIESVRRAGPRPAVQANGGPGVSQAAPLETAQDTSELSVEASWSLVTDAAANVDLDTATGTAGFALQPGAAERAALQLTPDEQRELVRLLQAAVEQPE
jgi:hypothetical protein